MVTQICNPTVGKKSQDFPVGNRVTGLVCIQKKRGAECERQ